ADIASVGIVVARTIQPCHGCGTAFLMAVRSREGLADARARAPVMLATGTGNIHVVIPRFRGDPKCTERRRRNCSEPRRFDRMIPPLRAGRRKTASAGRFGFCMSGCVRADDRESLCRDVASIQVAKLAL